MLMLGAVGGMVAGLGIAVVVGILRDLRQPPRRRMVAAAATGLIAHMGKRLVFHVPSLRGAAPSASSC